MLMQAETESPLDREAIRKGRMPRIVVDANKRRQKIDTGMNVRSPRRGMSVGLNGNYKTSPI